MHFVTKGSPHHVVREHGPLTARQHAVRMRNRSEMHSTWTEATPSGNNQPNRRAHAVRALIHLRYRQGPNQILTANQSKHQTVKQCMPRSAKWQSEFQELQTEGEERGASNSKEIRCTTVSGQYFLRVPCLFCAVVRASATFRMSLRQFSYLIGAFLAQACDGKASP